jgi:hypothetical protein
MKNILILIILLGASSLLQAQFPQGWDTLDQIIKLRSDLKNAIRANDPKSGAIVTEELRNLSGKTHWSLMWDERWLVYHWSSRHRLLLDEVAAYSYSKRMMEEEAKTAPADSLFETVDQAMYQNSVGYDAVLQDLGLNPEERVFTDLHLQYLLRNNQEEEKIRRDSFIKKYPGSKYSSFIKQFMILPKPTRRHYFSFDVQLINFSWRSELERSLQPGWGAGFGLYYHRNLFIVGGKFAFSRQKTLRTLYLNSDFDNWAWPKNSPSSFNKYAIEVGMKVLDRPKIRVWPSAEAGWTNILAQDDEDDPDTVPLSSVFNYDSGTLGVSINAELKMSKKGGTTKATKSTLYNGVILKLGYNWLYFGASDAALRGNVLFFALGYQFSGR